jgi:23S rRNA (guanine2445-N2)-methyltransferase / 23S rRNA (guanine2069-N7)-methyltransferase
MIFSNNLRTFELDIEELSVYSVENISNKTIDDDFKRNPKIHQCWIIRH